MSGYKRNWRKIVSIAIVALAIFAMGLMAGFFIGKSSVNRSLTNRPPASSEQTEAGTYKRGAELLNGTLRTLPPPGSPEAKQLLSDPNTDASIRALYTFTQDATLITENSTAAFLEQLQEQLAAKQAASDGSEAPAKINIEPFVRVARDVLNYLRYSNSQALLLLLRQYSNTGGITMSDVDPDLLQHEVDQLLNVTNLSMYYGARSKADTSEITTLPPPPAPKATAEMLTGASQAASGRRRLRITARRLYAATAIPDIPEDAAAPTLIPTASPAQDLQDMLCSIAPYAPSGLQGMKLPARLSNGTDRTLRCKPPRQGVFQYGKVAFKPVVLPVAFHIQQFKENDIIHPRLSDPEAAAQNLIKVSNRHFQGTGIQFKLETVHHDIYKYPYLLFSNKESWQDCSGHMAQERAGFPCLTATAQYPEVVKLAENHVINVFVSGSKEPTGGYCDPDVRSVCQSLYLGYSRAMGPWWNNPSPTWREGFSDENWIFMSYDQFNPDRSNAEKFWDGGAATLAHELGHYLGLMHTHEGASLCDGDGFDSADAVPDTPVNMQVEEYAVANGLFAQLAGWCADFRKGKKPDPAELLPFNSCKKPNRVDNVFNLLSYLPDQCCMLLTDNQVARLQWATATFRPKMVAAYMV